MTPPVASGPVNIVSIGPMTTTHLEAVVAIEALSHPDPKGLTNFATELTNTFATCLVAIFDTTVVGYLIGWRAADELEVVDIAVHPTHRGRHLADALLASLYAVDPAARVFLEVRESNTPARRLYTRHGFTEVGRRRHYYNDNGEDALVLSRPAPADAVHSAPPAPTSPAQSSPALVQGLYPILSDDVLAAADFPAAAVLLAEHVTVLQLRFKRSDDASALQTCRDTRDALATWPGLLIINDRADFVRLLATDAVPSPKLGLHVGQGDLPPATARAIIGPDAHLGFSTHDLGQLTAALTLATDPTRLDYVAFGPVFPTATKLNPDPVVGLETLSAAASLVAPHHLPLVAIGGLDPDRAAAAIAAGATSVAVIGALFRDGLAGLVAATRGFTAAIDPNNPNKPANRANRATPPATPTPAPTTTPPGAKP
jgi:thiamine-phosphate pyrophosphorylase